MKMFKNLPIIYKTARPAGRTKMRPYKRHIINTLTAPQTPNSRISSPLTSYLLSLIPYILPLTSYLSHSPQLLCQYVWKIDFLVILLQAIVTLYSQFVTNTSQKYIK